MKKIVFPFILLGVLMLTACSSDDDANSNCDSCSADSGTRYEICDNGNGTFTLTSGGVSETFTEEELDGFTPEEIVQLACLADGELVF